MVDCCVKMELEKYLMFVSDMRVGGPVGRAPRKLGGSANYATLLWWTWWEKVGNLARSLQGNLTIWKEICFEIKKYIRNRGKSYFLAGKNTLFQAVGMDPGIFQ